MKLYVNELFKLFKTKKLYVFLLILIVNVALAIYYYGSGGSIISTANGQSLPLAFINGVAQFMSVFIPIYVAEIFTEDYKAGTLKLSLLRPISRMQSFHSKVAALLTFNVVLVFAFVLFTYASGTLVFGWGDSTVYNGTAYLGIDGVLLTVISYALLLLPYMAYGMLASFIAVVSDNMTATIGITIGISVAGQYLNAIPSIKIYSLVNQLYFFHEYFVMNFNLGEAVLSSITNVAYFTVFYLLTARCIKKKDILC